MSAAPAERARHTSSLLTVEGFDLALSLQAAARFLPAIEPASEKLRVGIDFDGRPAIVELRQSGERLEAVGPPFIGSAALREIAAGVVNAALDLRPFYALCADHPVLGPVARSLRGLKPLRPASLFEMLVIAITEQQFSLAAAFHIRRRLVERLVRRYEGVWLFPTPAMIAGAPIATLKTCGLSGRKAEYVVALAGKIAAGKLDLGAIEVMSDAEARAALARQRGLREWSIDDFLARGLGRPDCLTAGDVSLRRVVGRYLAVGTRLSSDELRRVLADSVEKLGIAWVRGR